MHAHGVDIGAVQQALVRGGIIGLDALDQFVLTQELGAAARPLRGRRAFLRGDGLKRRLDGERF
jgi:hypothetical protein